MLTLALGVGGTTAIFSLIHAVMLRSLPVADPASLYRVGDGNACCVQGGPQDRWGMYSYPLFERIKAATPEFEQLAAFQAGGWVAAVRREGGEIAPRPLRSEYVTGNYFAVFGLNAFAGRLFTEADDRAGAPPVAVLSYRAWQSYFGGKSSVIGANFMVEGVSFTVAGIAPPGFFGETLRSDPPDIWLPLQQEPLVRGGGSLLRQSISSWLRVIGRVKPGASVDGMGARLTVLLRQWIERDAGYPPEWMGEIRQVLSKQTISIVPAGAGVAEMKEDYSRSLQILLAVCGMVLLIACANLANLLLARGMARRAQTSIRVAIGASRGHLVRHALVESVLLALGGGLAGLAVAEGAQNLILAISFRTARYLPIDTTPSLPVLGFALAVSILTGILFGTAPAWLAMRTDPVEALRGAGRSTRDHSSFARNLLLVFQAALSVVLVAGATMLARSLSLLENQDLGFETKNRLSISLNAPPASYQPAQLDALYRNLEGKLSQVPGIEKASLALYNPFTDNWSDLIYVEGHPPAALNEKSSASWDRVTPGFFQAAGQPIVRGRNFNEADRGNNAPVAIVNEAFVRRFFPDEDPMDRRFGLDVPAYANTFRIVGIVRDAKYIDPRKPARPMFFVPLAQWVSGYQEDIMQKVEMNSHFISNALIVTRMQPGAMEPVLRKTLAEVDPNLTLNNVRAMKDQVALSFDQQRAVASLAGLFGVVALILAAVGLYGVTSYAVAQRTAEIGVRMALGAGRESIVKLVLRGAFRKVGFGLLLGIPLAAGAGRLIEAQLYGVKTWDPWSLGMACGALVACALLAAMVPAVRAAGLDPIQALRRD